MYLWFPITDIQYIVIFFTKKFQISQKSH